MTPTTYDVFIIVLNIFYKAADRAVLPIRVLRKGGMLMTTYEEFMIILTIGLLIVEILDLKNK